MGTGSIFVGHMAEVTIPTLLIFALAYAGAKGSWGLKASTIRVFSMFLLSLLISGVLYALLYQPINETAYGVVALIGIPLVVSLLIIYLLAPRTNGPAP